MCTYVLYLNYIQISHFLDNFNYTWEWYPVMPIAHTDESLQERAGLMPTVRAARSVTTTTANATNLNNARSARARAPTDTQRQAAKWAGCAENVSQFRQNDC